jgi:hypothetical protein
MEELYGRAFTFSNHTLGRTGGRMMYRAQGLLATISSIMGHESVVQTIKYLGINLDDQADAFALVAQYEKGLSAPKSGFFRHQPVTCSGPKEIWSPSTIWLETDFTVNGNAAGEDRR